MSYILDALKKSDAEARKGQLPSIHSHHADDAQTASRPAWQYMLIGALGIVLLAAVGMQMFPVRQHAMSVAINAPASTPAIPRTTQAAPELPATSQPSFQAAPAPVETAVRQQTENKVKQTMPKPAQNPVAAKPSPPPSRTESPPEKALQNTPLRSQLPVSVQQSLPPIQISGHIFDPKPQARMVFINGHIQRQGDNISPQLRLLAITPSGVELEFRGTPFRIDIFRNKAFHSRKPQDKR